MWWLPGLLAATALLAVVAGALVALAFAASGFEFSSVLGDPYIRRVAFFTLWQALLSTLLSLALAVPVARALARRRAFPGRGLLLRIFSLSLVIPSVVAIFGIVAVHGRQGWVNHALEAIGGGGGHYLYGLTGILIAHVFFNMPLAARILLQALEAIPPESWRLASQFGMTSRHIFRLIEWPVLRQVLPGAAGLVFMLCFTSFAVVLTLGGGPRATTLEVAIYQALRFDFDIGRAVILALVQVLLAVLVVTVVLPLGRPSALAATEQRVFERPDDKNRWAWLVDGLSLGLAVVLVVVPLLAVALSGVNAKTLMVLGDRALWHAMGQSLAIALAAGGLALLLGTGLLLTSRALRYQRWRPGSAAALELSGSLVLVIPPFVLAAGLFVLLRPFADVLGLGGLLVVLVNGLMALPFVIRVLGGPMMRVAEQQDRLCQSLGITGRNRLRLVEWPLLWRSAGLSFAIAACLSAGDLGVIALFGSQDLRTLPLLLYQRMGSYRLEEAAVTAVVLAFFCFLLFMAIERLVGGRSRA